MLRSYKGRQNGNFWELFPKNYGWPGKSLIDADALEKLGKELYLWDARFAQVVQDIRSGAVLGCRGEPRLPTRSSNATSAYEFGPQVTDAVASWVAKGFVHGPVLPCELPKSAKVNGIMCREKPNGSVRIILNLSAPKGRGVNKGIRKEEFPAEMSSTQKFLEVLDRAGRGCEMVKVDWSDAYKHIPVSDGDLNLQWFKWLGMYFCELSLIFGCVSSVGNVHWAYTTERQKWFCQWWIRNQKYHMNWCASIWMMSVQRHRQAQDWRRDLMPCTLAWQGRSV